MLYTGQCRCGAIRYEWHTAQALSQKVARACQCSYCLSKDAAYLSEPDATLSIRQQPDSTHKVQHGFKTCDFIECAHCETLVYVCCAIDDRLYAIINAATLDDQSQLTQPPVPMVFAEETSAARTARRAKHWISHVHIQTS